MFRRVALVVHPTRPIDRALAALTGWAGERGIEVVQLDGLGGRRVAEPAQLDAGDLVVAMGGDGTVLTALHAAAGAPVLGVACGSLGVLSAVAGGEIAGALDSVWGGDWRRRSLPALAIATDGATERALNDFVVLRQRAGQVAVAVDVDDEPYVRFTGDGLIVATAMGSSAYSMAGGGPILAADTPAFVCTPLAMHGGSAPPLVVPADAAVTVNVTPGYAGFVVEIDGRRTTPATEGFRLTLEPDAATLVALGPAGHGLAGLRRRRLVNDSPRMLARDDRAAAASAHDRRPAGG